jgi:hypothetical protein
MTMAAQQAGALGTKAWLFGNPELSDVTLLLATKGGCDIGQLPTLGCCNLDRLGAGCGADVLPCCVHAEAKQAAARKQAAEVPPASHALADAQVVSGQAVEVSSAPAVSAEKEAPVAEEAPDGNGIQPTATRQCHPSPSETTKGGLHTAQRVSPPALAAEPEGTRISAHRHGLAF